jgi:hypothetical protein
MNHHLHFALANARVADLHQAAATGLNRRRWRHQPIWRRPPEVTILARLARAVRSTP